ncbi:PIF1 DNA helicase/replication protein A1-like protein [Artemisia annua]|uniref:PIF1 DNA helicase/replication protein A1-like protein n=1 Tax=Artemisia annua TaxID=35608 RepID=A0A2U1QEP5_ARTAN|nr:PIF1 DNA helicase/replication protein A1-like protein [Artemisia annua]
MLMDSTTNNRRVSLSEILNSQAPTIPLSGVQSKPSSFSLSNRVSSVGIAAQHISTPMNTVQSKSSAITTNNRGTSNVATNSPEVTPVATLRKRQTPLSNASTVSFQTPVVCQVNQRPRKKQPSGYTTTIPSLSTQKTTYETSESSRTTKKSKRPSLQKVSPIVFDLDDDGHVRKVYDNGSASTTSGGSNSNKPIDRTIINEVKDILDESSDLVKTFRRARDRYTENNEQNIRIKLVAKRGKNGRQYNLPTANEVAGLIVGDLDCCAKDRDIVIEKLGEGIPHIKKAGKQATRNTSEENGDEKIDKTVSMREWFAYQIQDRPNRENLYVRGGRLFQQFLVDGYAMVETERMFFHRSKQTKLRFANE